jgi:glycosyltransferase involved in cell wall biosynthesis
MGSGPCEPYLRKVARDVEGVHFIGYVDSPNIKKLLYESCLAVVVPSMHETLPTVIIEAMACRKPIIASNVGGNPFMVKNGKNGFLVKPKDIKNMSRFIKVIYQNPDLRKKMGEYGRKLVERKFSYEKMVTETLKVYETMLHKD